jgi:uncharacterized iron-regulated membrane protein
MNWRKYHRIISIFIFIPFLLVVMTGLLLQVRQVFEGIQPKAVAMEFLPNKPLLSLDDMVLASKIPPTEIDQIIYRPSKFHLAIRVKDGRELQLHPQTGEILKSAPRLTGLLIELHQGSFFTSISQYGIFLPTGIGVLFLLISGIVIYPWKRKYEK